MINSSVSCENEGLREPDFNIRTFFQVDALDESHFAGLQGQDYGGSARTFAEEADTFHQRPVGNSGGSEDELFAGSEVFGFVDSFLVFDAHASEALFLIGFHYQAAEHVAVEAADGGGSDHALRGSA